MADNSLPGFGNFVPGFDFLQNIAKGASQSLPQMPNLSSWIAPTLSVEELEKRIGDLKAVHFWLEQNSKALGATIQALEVQKMTLATLKGMNFNLAEVADAFKMKAEPKPQAASPAKPSAGIVDPMQWWGALTQQFQQIATNAMKDAAAHTAKSAAKEVAAGVATKAAKKSAPRASAKRPAKKSPR